ncbi:hypothetical protein PSTT_05648 [Puccinia striiformis]|uniref:Uncharacterized protein n=1 Tax=Puccinia striiformis TaxID=27350 RepID=A0A2S4VND2_9BASI|nr:hypothetical protein PSTT_05648 [Puccinia striiformis]
MSKELDLSDLHPSDKLVQPVNLLDRSVRLANWSDLQVQPVETCRTETSDFPLDNVVRAPSPRKAQSAVSNKSDGWSGEPARGPVKQGNPTSA